MLHTEHDCQIPDVEGDVLFLPGRGPFRRLYDTLRLSLMASRRNPAAYKYLRSTAAIVHEKRRHWRSFTFIIHPFSLFRYFWDLMMITVTSSVLLLVPYQATFEMGLKSKLWNIGKNFLLMICCIDIMVNFTTGQVSSLFTVPRIRRGVKLFETVRGATYFDKEAHKVVLERKKIMNHYIKSSTFFPDLIGSFPTDLFYVYHWWELLVTRKTTSLVCIFRVFSLRSRIHKLTSTPNIPIAVCEFCQILFWTLLALHWQSCFHWLVPIITKSMYQLERPSDDSWIHVHNLWETKKSQQYLASTLRGIATFMTANLLVTNPRNMADIFLIVVLQVLGLVAPWLLITKVMQFFKGTNSSRLKYQGTVAQLKQYMRHKQLPYPTQKRIIEYYEFRFQRRFFRESVIIHTLSAQVRHEIRMHSCRKLVESVTFLNNLPLALLGRIVSLLKSEIFLINDVIVRANQPGDCMYFIATGTVAIYTNSGKEVCHLEDGAHFGEVALVMPDEMRVASVVAVEACELYRLNRADFARTIQPYPMLWETIKNVAIERHEKTMILNEQ